MFTSFEHLMNFKGRKVKVFTSSYSNQECFEDTGILTNLVIGLGDNDIIRIEVID